MKLLVLVAIALAGCASANLPDHVFNELPGAYVDMFWWLEPEQCDMRITYIGGSTGAKGAWLRDVPIELCQDAMPTYRIRRATPQEPGR